MKLTAKRALKDFVAEGELFRRRALVGFLIIAVCLGLLLTRFFYLQVVHYDEFNTRSEANRVKLRPLPPTRGLIYDRNGRLLADNIPAFRLELIPEQVGDLEKTLRELADVVALSEDDLTRFRELKGLKRRFQSVPLRFRLNEDEVARFSVNRHRFPGVEVVPYLTRRYPMGGEFAHVVGYVGRLDKEDQERLDQGRYAATSHIGKTGIERYYEDLLHGEVGYERVETNAEGRVLRELDRVPPRPGKHLFLTIDAELQATAVAAFEGRSGAAVAIDPRSGQVLAMVSLPGFDPNPFVNGVTHADYAALLAARERPLFNRALLGGYEPGSTIKPFVAIAGLELGLRRPEDTVFSTGSYKLPGQEHEYRDWKRGGHGTVNLNEALAQSVNLYFYRLAVDLGIDRLSSYMSQFGFGAATGIDLNGEGTGILPSRQWKQATQNVVWFPGETVISGIGQGFWVVTPLQLSHAVATLAAEGKSIAPHLLLASQDGFNAEVIVEPYAAQRIGFFKDRQSYAAVREGMVAVAHGPTGTARAAFADSAYRVAAKSGTAQRVGRKDGEDYDQTRIAEHLRHQALFIAFAPAEDPRIALALVVEHGGSGSRAAAPVARRIIDAWLARNPP